MLPEKPALATLFATVAYDPRAATTRPPPTLVSSIPVPGGIPRKSKNQPAYLVRRRHDKKVSDG